MNCILMKHVGERSKRRRCIYLGERKHSRREETPANPGSLTDWKNLPAKRWRTEGRRKDSKLLAHMAWLPPGKSPSPHSPLQQGSPPNLSTGGAWVAIGARSSCVALIDLRSLLHETPLRHPQTQQEGSEHGVKDERALGQCWYLHYCVT